jgi:hypothetical protein
MQPIKLCRVQQFRKYSAAIIQFTDRKQHLVAAHPLLPDQWRSKMYMNNKAFTQTPQAKVNIHRGFALLYHADVVNHCPACGHTHWHIGRMVAQCAFCETALPLSVSSSQPAEPLFFFKGSSTAMAA